MRQLRLYAIPLLLSILAAPAPSGAVTLAVGDILVAVGASVVHIDPVTLDQTVVSSGGFLTSAHGPAVSEAGEIFVADLDTDAIIGIDPGTGQQRIVSSGGLLDDPRDVEIAGSGQLIVGGGIPGIVQVDPSDGSQLELASDESGVIDLIVEPGGDSILFTTFFNGIWRKSLTTLDETTVLTPGFANFGPLGIALDAAGDLWSTEGTPLIRRDAITGDFLGFLPFPDDAAGVLSGIVVDPLGRFVVQTELEGIQKVDPTTGVWEPIAALSGSGLAIVTALPEPGSALLWLAALLTGALARRRPARG